MPLRLVAALVLVVAATACGANERGADGGDGRLSVVVAVAPLADAVSAIAGARAEVHVLADPDVEAHDLELTPDQVDAVEDAAVVVMVGRGFQPAVEEAVRRRGAEGVVDVTAATGTDERDSERDPHVWLDPVRFGEIVERIAAELIEQSPDDADAFRAGATRFRGELEELDRVFASTLGTCRRRTIVTAHAAFGHLAARYDLDERSLAGLSPEAEPGAAAVARLADAIRADGTTTVFDEPGGESESAAALAAEAGVTTAVLDPLERPAEGGYLAAMRRNLSALRAALDCG